MLAFGTRRNGAALSIFGVRPARRIPASFPSGPIPSLPLSSYRTAGISSIRRFSSTVPARSFSSTMREALVR